MDWTGRTRRLMWTGQKYRPVRVQMTSLYCVIVLEQTDSVGHSGLKIFASRLQISLLTLHTPKLQLVSTDDEEDGRAPDQTGLLHNRRSGWLATATPILAENEADFRRKAVSAVTPPPPSVKTSLQSLLNMQTQFASNTVVLGGGGISPHALCRF